MTSRFPFPIPFGWFQVAFADDLEPGEIKPMRYFGRDLVMWRSESGALRLQDAYCPHLGGNFGVDGQVSGERIRCPFHKWEFDGEGRVAAIPYAQKLNEKACVRTYPLQLKYGLAMAWYHPGGSPPSYELPDVPEFENGAYTAPRSTRHEIRTCLQEMAENSADSAHFATVHNHPGNARYARFDCIGESLLMESTQLFPSSGGPVEGTLSSASTGFGWAVVRYQTLIDVCMLTTNAPIDDAHVVQYFHVSWRNPDGDDRVDRIGRAFDKEVNRQFTDDQRIWESKIYVDSPQLCDGDGPIAKLRGWAQQFYVQEAR